MCKFLNHFANERATFIFDLILEKFHWLEHPVSEICKMYYFITQSRVMPSKLCWNKQRAFSMKVKTKYMPLS